MNKCPKCGRSEGARHAYMCPHDPESLAQVPGSVSSDEKYIQSVIDRLMEGHSFVGKLAGIHEVFKGWPFFRRKIGYRACSWTVTGRLVIGEVRQTPKGAMRSLAQRTMNTMP